MNIRLDKLKERPQPVVFSEPATEFPALKELAERDGVEFTAPVRGDLVATWAGDVIEVSGRLTTGVLIPCSRCLEEVRCPCDIKVSLCYRRLQADTQAAAAPDVELEEEDLGLIPVTGETIDLHAELGQEIIMALPQQPLCKEDCAGLCPVCGGNRNHAVCQCEKPVLHAGLEALKNFKLEK